MNGDRSEESTSLTRDAVNRTADVLCMSSGDGLNWKDPHK